MRGTREAAVSGGSGVVQPLMYAAWRQRGFSYCGSPARLAARKPAAAVWLMRLARQHELSGRRHERHICRLSPTCCWPAADGRMGRLCPMPCCTSPAPGLQPRTSATGRMCSVCTAGRRCSPAVLRRANGLLLSMRAAVVGCASWLLARNPNASCNDAHVWPFHVGSVAAAVRCSTAPHAALLLPLYCAGAQPGCAQGPLDARGG